MHLEKKKKLHRAVVTRKAYRSLSEASFHLIVD